MGALIKLYAGVEEYLLSDINREYVRGYDVAGNLERADNGTLGANITAIKAIHTVAYSDLNYDAAEDGGVGLGTLEALMVAKQPLTMIVNDYGATTVSATVLIDPREFRPRVYSDGWGREYWGLEMVLREV